MKYYEIEVAGLKRQLPIVAVSEDVSIAAFIILGDIELVEATAKALLEKMPKADILVTAEAKGIPLVIELARLLGHKRYVVARKSLKVYMEDPFGVKVNSITTAREQNLYLDRNDTKLLEGKKVIIVDDVISTGKSLAALEKLIEKTGGEVVAKVAILVEGEASQRQDIISIGELPLL